MLLVRISDHSRIFGALPLGYFPIRGNQLQLGSNIAHLHSALEQIIRSNRYVLLPDLTWLLEMVQHFENSLLISL